MYIKMQLVILSLIINNLLHFHDPVIHLCFVNANKRNIYIFIYIFTRERNSREEGQQIKNRMKRDNTGLRTGRLAPHRADND